MSQGLQARENYPGPMGTTIRKQEQLPMGSRSPHKHSIAGAHSLHKEGVCATCHRTQEVPGRAKGSSETRLPAEITPQWWLWKTCIAKHEPARTRPARWLCQGWCWLKAMTCLWSVTPSPPSHASWCKVKLQRPQTPGGFVPSLSLFEGLIPKGSCILSHTPLYTCFVLVTAS